MIDSARRPSADGSTYASYRCNPPHTETRAFVAWSRSQRMGMRHVTVQLGVPQSITCCKPPRHEIFLYLDNT